LGNVICRYNFLSYGEREALISGPTNTTATLAVPLDDDDVVVVASGEGVQW
jgi:hypothetical protein